MVEVISRFKKISSEAIMQFSKIRLVGIMREK